MSKGKLWIIYYCILEMEADNEPAISLPKSHYGSWSTVIFKMKICYTKKQNKTKGQETKKHRLGQTPDLRVIYCPTTTTVDSR